MVRSSQGAFGLMRENLGIKIGSVILACSIWWFVVSQQEAVTSYEVPLRVINIPKGIILTQKSTGMIQVQVRGLTNNLNLLTDNQIQPTIEIDPATKPGNLTYQLRFKDIRIPEGFKIDSVNPSTIELTFEKEIIRVVPVSVSVKGVPAEGYELGKTRVKPESTRISGPESIVKELDTIYTETVDVSEKSLTWEARTALIAPSNLITFLDKKTADIQIQFIPKIVEITLVSYKFQQIPSKYPTTFEPDDIHITLKGPELKVKQLQNFPTKDLIIGVDASKLKPGKHNLAPQVILIPQDISIMSMDPPTITVTIQQVSS